MGFQGEVEKEKTLLQNNIEEILKFYSTVCNEREDVLMKLHSALDGDDDEFHGRSSPLNVEDLEIISGQMLSMIQDMDYKTEKLKRVHGKLKRLVSIGVKVGNKTKSGVEGKNEAKIQRKVVDQFKKLQGLKASQREKAETWKHAATEIVDLLRSVRQEGALDFEVLENEFQKMVSAFTAQSDMLEEKEKTVNKQKKIIQQHVRELEQYKNDSILMQDQLEGYRTNLKQAQNNILKLEEKVIYLLILHCDSISTIYTLPSQIAGVFNYQIFDFFRPLQFISTSNLLKF